MSPSSVVEGGELSRRLGLITAIPQTVHRGNGCYVGISTTAAGATTLGNTVEMITPEVRLGASLVERYLFNHEVERVVRTE